MNILYLCADRGIPVRGHKGAAVHVRAMSDAFVRAGHQVTIFTPRFGLSDGPLPLAELVKVPLPPRPKADFDDNNYYNEATALDRQSQAYNEVLYAAVREWLVEHEVDFIYERYSLWSDVGAQLSRETGLPLLLEVNAPLCEEAARYRHLSDAELAAQVEASQFEAAHSIAVVSEALREYVISKGAGADKVHVLPNGVDPQHFHPGVRGCAVHERHGLHERIIVGFVGRARPWHDLETLLQAVGQLHAEDSRYHLLLVGKMSEQLPAQLEHYGLSDVATVTGAVPHETVPEYIAAMDVAVSSHLPLKDFYFSPLKLYEYLACGVATVSANIGQPSRLIEDGVTGYLYQPGDASSLATCIRHLVEHPAHAREVAWQGAVSVLEKHTWDQNAQKVIAWVEADRKGGEVDEQKGATHLFSAWQPGKVQQSLPIIDRKLRQRLYRATRADLAQPWLADYFSTFKKKAANVQQVAQIEVLKYKPGRRCVLGYDLVGEKNGQLRQQRVIGKVFRDERGRRLHHLQQKLWLNGFGPSAPDGIHVARSLGYVPKMRMQVQDYAPGETLNVLLEKGQVSHFVARAAEAIAKLHHEDPAKFSDPSHNITMRTYLLANELKQLDRLTENLITYRPQLSLDVFRLRDALLEWGQQLPALPVMRPIHRDFYYSQLLFDEDRVMGTPARVILIDLDLLALGDPAIDVANFATHLTLMAMEFLADQHALTEETTLFLHNYARFGPVDDTFWQRFAFYRAATFFRLLHVVTSRPNLVHLFDQLYEETMARIENRA